MRSFKLIILFLFGLLFSNESLAQFYGPVDSRFFSIRQNSVSTMEALGDTLWISPALNRNIGNNADWYTPENADSVINGAGRLFSVSLSPDTVVAGLGTSVDLNGSSIPTAYGYYLSTDGGEFWEYFAFPLDPEPGANCEVNSVAYDPDCDISFTYGSTTYRRTRITVPQQSPPYDIAHRGNVILSASWASGLVRSTDFGQSWERVILPPSSVDSLSPNGNYRWNSQYRGQNVERYDPRFDNNLLGFGLLIDSSGQVWFGSAGGLNISDNALDADISQISWKHVSFRGPAEGLLGSWIIAIEENPTDGSIWMTNWSTDGGAGERFGIVSTSDNGNTFERHLIGERINDISFQGGYIYAAGDNGLFYSNDNGSSWIKLPPIESPNTFIKPEARFLSTTVTTNRLWVGTNDGIASSSDNGQTWEITRVNFPLSGGNVFDPEGRESNSYAYPNPFSPTIHDVVRIKFEVSQTSSVQLRIFDFRMNLIKVLKSGQLNPGEYEVAWDGYDNDGRKAANNPYIYVLEIGDNQETGKILLVD